MVELEHVLGNARFGSRNHRFRLLLREALSRFPEDATPLASVTRLQLRKKGAMKGLVGLTTYCCVEARDSKNSKDRPSQRITFYSELLDQLSDEAAIGVIAHELAHAWLNEHTTPEDSKKRELQADELARGWGYGGYLDTLASETEAV